MFANTEQIFILLIYSFAVGCGLGVLSDLLNTLRESLFTVDQIENKERIRLPENEKKVYSALFPSSGKFTARDVLMVIFDILFFAIAAIVVIILLYHLNFGQMRVYSLVSALTGYVVYKKTVGKLVTFLLMRMLYLAAFGIRKALLFITFPIRFAIKKTLYPIFELAKQGRIRKKARKYIELMEKNVQKEVEK